MDILRVTGFAVVASLILTHTALTQEKKIKHSDLPAAVKKTVAAQIHGAKIRGFSEEKRKAKLYTKLS